MRDQAARRSRLVDLFGEAGHVVLIATGCYAGWKAGKTFAALLAGGTAARVGWFFLWGLFHLARGQDPPACPASPET